MANANTEKINFNVSPNLKRNVERLASSYGKTLSAFMLDVCNQLVKVNADRIKEQAEREKQPINFGTSDVKPTTKTKKARRTNTKKAAQFDFPANSAAYAVKHAENTVAVHATIKKVDTPPRRTVTAKRILSSDESLNGDDENG